MGGRYRLLGKIGQGGMGTVYLAEHGLSGRRVALKIIRRELESSSVARSRFLRECESLERIDSPHVVQVLESGESPAGEIYLVMERLLGTTLGERLDSGALPLDDVPAIGAQIASALAAAHGKGVVHRDLKPDNVFLCQDGLVKVLDFGIARLLDGQTLDGGGAKKLTATGTIVGTPAYMSPEGAAGETVGPQGDLYSLGVILYEMVSGQPPFWDEKPVLVLGKHLKEKPPPLPPSVPPELARLIDALLQKDPSKRPASADEIVRVLSGLASGVHTLPTARPARRVARRVLALVAIAVLAALVGGGAALWMAPTAEPDPPRTASTRQARATDEPHAAEPTPVEPDAVPIVEDAPVSPEPAEVAGEPAEDIAEELAEEAPEDATEPDIATSAREQPPRRRGSRRRPRQEPATSGETPRSRGGLVREYY